MAIDSINPARENWLNQFNVDKDTGNISSNLNVNQFPQPIIPTTGWWDSIMNWNKNTPWMSTQGTTVETVNPVTGLPMKTFNPGITGKFETLGKYGNNVLEGLSLWQGIQGGRAQAENAKLYGTFMKDQLAAAQDARRFNNERSKVQHRLNSGESANTAYATLNNWRTV